MQVNKLKQKVSFQKYNIPVLRYSPTATRKIVAVPLNKSYSLKKGTISS